MKTNGVWGVLDSPERVYTAAKEWSGSDGEVTPAEYVKKIGKTEEWRIVAHRADGTKRQFIYYRW